MKCNLRIKLYVQMVLFLFLEGVVNFPFSLMYSSLPNNHWCKLINFFLLTTPLFYYITSDKYYSLFNKCAAFFEEFQDGNFFKPWFRDFKFHTDAICCKYDSFGHYYYYYSALSPEKSLTEFKRFLALKITQSFR